MPYVDFTNYELLRLFRVNGLDILQGSDHHIPLRLAAQFIEALIDQSCAQSSDMLILNGDLFHTPYGEAAQEAIGHLLNRVAARYKNPIVYVPGNHCLRGTGKEAWKHFGALPKNVYAPLANPLKPIVLRTPAGKMVVGNIFYDFKFLDPSLFRLTKKDIRTYYADTHDGQHLFDGRTEDFPLMADNVARAITPDTKFLVTHCLPHPMLVKFIQTAKTEITERLEREHEIRFVYRSITKQAAQWNMTEEACLDFLTKKSFIMGSNVLNREGFEPAPEGLVIFQGHNHQSKNKEKIMVAGRKMIVCSHQNPYNSALSID